jgi:hypothetical protein
MLRARASSSLAILAGLAAGSLAFAQPKDADVRLEGSGNHRAMCTAMQLKSFNPALWGDLTKWSGTPVTAELTKDKPVLIVTWTSYAKTTNNAAITLAQRLFKQHGDKGLIVVGVHNPKGFDSAKAIADELGVTFPYAADEQSKFRNSLLTDQDPDFYIIDRAGNLRFSDVETASVERAVDLVLAETPEIAAAVPGNLAKSIAEQEREKLRMRDVKGLVQPGAPLTVPFTPPPDESYARASWPGVVTKTGVSQWDQMAEKIRKDRPVMTLNDEGWASPKPVSTGRVSLIYLFDPLDTEIAQVAAKMSRLQSAHARDLVVVANLRKIRDDGASATEEEKQRTAERRINTAKDYVRQTGLNHGMNVISVQLEGQELNDIVVPVSSRREVTLAFLVSSDGHCRWVGNQYWDGFETVVSEFIDTDPGVRARRKAEDAQAKLSGN